MTGFNATRIADFCATGSGGTPSRNLSERYYEGGTIPWVKSGELRETIINSTAEYVTETALKESSIKLVPAGAILLAMYGATVGRLGILGVEATTNQAVCHIVPDPNVAETRYVFHAINNRVPNLISMGVGGAQPNINQAIIKNLEIPLPPLHEQRRIAAILDQADALRAKRREALAQLDSLTQSIFIEMFGDPNANEKNWGMVTLAEICNGISDINHKMPKAVEQGIPFISAKDLVENGKISFDDVKRISEDDFRQLSRKSKPEKGDILYSRIGVNLGKARMVVVEFDFLASYSCCTIKPNRRIVDANFLCHLLDSPFILKQAHKGVRAIAVPDLGMGEIKSFKIILPPMEKQKEFSTRVTVLEKMKTAHFASLSELDALFASLQHRAFRGEL